MHGFFQRYGRELLANGYLIVPIRPGTKAPALARWPRARLGADDLDKYPGCGVGVLCGQGAYPIAAFDVDTLDETLARDFSHWLQSELGLSCERVGKAPKVLLPYRAASAGWRKATSGVFTDDQGRAHQLEVLGEGQNFIAYHVHPDTGRPYGWIDFLGGIVCQPANELHVVSPEQVAAAIDAFEAMAAKRGFTRTTGAGLVGGVDAGGDSLMRYSPPVGIALEDARCALVELPSDDYDLWLRVGMALHHEYAGDDAALRVWDEWSCTSASYVGFDDLQTRWAAFGRGNGVVGINWLLKTAKDARQLVLRAEKRDALATIKAAIAACKDSIDLLDAVAQEAGTVAGGDVAVRAELECLLRARFKELTGSALSIVDTRKAMTVRQVTVTGAPKRRGMTEFGNADRMLDRYGEGLIYVPELERWHCWTGVYWKPSVDAELEHLAKQTVLALSEEARTIDNDDERAAFLKFCAASQSARMVRNILSLARSDLRVVVGYQQLDQDKSLLGVGNGVVDLRTGKLLAPNPEHYVTTITPVCYNPGATAPLFEQTVLEVFNGDTDLVSFFQRLIGYTLLGNPTEDVLVIPYGMGSNGKSTVIGAIRAVFGDHAKSASADTFLSAGKPGSGANAGAAREDLLRLRGARFVYIGEPDENSELREGFIKAMTGGEAITARGLWAKHSVEVKPTWTAFMPTNHRPIVKGEDYGIWRRLMTVPFTRNFDTDPTVTKDPDREAKLATEYEGILTWCVQGALAYRRHGLRAPAAVQRSRDDYRADMDLLSDWLSECCHLGPSCEDTTARLWASWEGFARSRGELRFIPSARSLGRRLASRGMALKIKKIGGKTCRIWSGLRAAELTDF